jgi:two-component system response regulator PilR (NtrC family)
MRIARAAAVFSAWYSPIPPAGSYDDGIDFDQGLMTKPTVLIVDDEPDLLELVSLTLSRMSMDTRTASDVGTAQKLLKTGHFDLCLTDMRLPDGDGLDLVGWIQEYHPQVPVAVITAHGNVESAVRALKLGAFDFVSKPLDLGVLRKLVGSAIRLGMRPDGQLTTTVPGPRLIGRSQTMQQLREMIARVARSQAPVHIFGESGTGKELVARLIHDSGARSEGPFIAVNCGAIPTELMESELFGHKRGSFTGAVADKKGLVQSAEGGTLFLDEVADLPLHMQVKLLRVVQEKTVRPVGESREETVDVRILSATHKNLAQLVAEGRFREDLFYRINVIEMRVPSLRERPEDIPELADAILQRLSRRMKMDPPHLSPEGLQMLESYGFPGNVRELENVLERAVTLCTGGVITADNIKVRATVRPPGEIPVAVTAPASGGGALGEQLEDIERDAIVKALEKTRYNKTAAAKLLGMSFRALRYRIKKLGIE